MLCWATRMTMGTSGSLVLEPQDCFKHRIGGADELGRGLVGMLELDHVGQFLVEVDA